MTRSKFRRWLFGAAIVYITLMLAVLCGCPLFSSARAETGMASWYGRESGRFTADGRRFNPDRLSCASWRYPLGSHLRVTDLYSARVVVVLVNDRGPARWTGRVIDLSRGAAIRLGFIQRGTTRVQIQRVR